MKAQYYLLTALCFFLTGCNYLDLEPERKGTLQEVFEDRTSAENFLYGCYGFMPPANDFNGEPQLWGAGDEVSITSNWGTDWHWAKAAHIGQISAAEPLCNYWSHHKSKIQPARSAGYDLYSGIRQCYTFIDMVDRVPNASVTDKAQWKAEARFLIAYFHYVLLRLYGPICIVEGIVPNDAPESVYYPKRLPYDDCVKWIATKLDEAAAELKLHPYPSPAVATTDIGRANYVAAKSIKARMLLYAASPLFNGNDWYADFKNKDGEVLINQTFDKEKWKLALDATAEAIAAAKAEGFKLYKRTGTTTEESAYLSARYVMVDRSTGNNINPEQIWAYSKGAVNSQQMYAIRGLASNSVTVPYGGVSPSFRMVETFLTKNGLPMDVDPAYAASYANRYVPVQDDKGEWTATMHIGREPRFYADIAYDRAQNYELSGKTFTVYLRMGERQPATNLTMGNDPGRDMQTINGYLIKKAVHPGSTYANNALTNQNYAWPMIRLTELYLNYAEAYVEYYGNLGGDATTYMDEIRDRAGIPRVDAAWTGISGRNDLDIVRRERTIELMFEGHRFFDARRWKTAHETFPEPSKSWNCFATGFTVSNPQTYDDYLKIISSNESTKTFERKHYLYPIAVENVLSNPNLVQNPGW